VVDSSAPWTRVIYAHGVASQNTFVLASVIAAAALMAFLNRGPSHASPGGGTQAREEEFDRSDEEMGEELPPDHPPINGVAAEEMGEELPPDHPPVNGAGSRGESLPPDHPPIGAPGAQPIGLGAAAEEPPALAWSIPKSWKLLPNSNTMRLFTYRIPAAQGAPDAAELSIVRAGGSADANLQRWVEQFEGAVPGKRERLTVNGFEVHTLAVSGTFTAGAMGGAAAARAGWALKGAVVDTAAGAYFFKLTGPEASVRMALTDFDLLIKSLRKPEAATL
jgi:hypothetical protein